MGFEEMPWKKSSKQTSKSLLESCAEVHPQHEVCHTVLVGLLDLRSWSNAGAVYLVQEPLCLSCLGPVLRVPLVGQLPR